MVNITLASQLDMDIKAVCPIIGVSIGRNDDKTTWSINFLDSATEEQQTLAQQIINEFDNTSYLGPLL